ncbi:hypothetical protein [Tenacibaculum xiamenense]|uniref:hypothetical protein n=1 Tax=Tenacibaculum xiamenense TaxID=1261553 RepID=UPI0038938D70
MDLHQRLDQAKELFAQEFPSFLSFIFTEIRTLHKASEMASVLGDEQNSRFLEQQAKKLSNSIDTIVKHYLTSSVSLFDTKEA